mmetsp:Transcript_12298/g.13913  ORF Transcript_12298/g.13913 Transcript_12298/m.13913 type:complete len:163 (+) Transcript_12298:93-581(+)
MSAVHASYIRRPNLPPVFSLLCLASFLPLAARLNSPQISLEDLSSSDEVMLIEFYHPQCDTCKLFSPAFTALEGQMKASIQVHQVSVKERRGERLAADVGALDEGIPNVRLYHRKGDTKGTTIMAEEDPLPSAEVMRERIEKILADHTLSDGHYLKSGLPEL